MGGGAAAPRSAIVIGGGIGGLAAAVALRQAGWPTQVFEQAPALEAAGAGITLFANAIKALRRLGLAEAVAAAGELELAPEIRRPDGTVLAAAPGAALEQRLGAPNIALHRADLQRILLEAQAAPPVLGAELTGVAQEAGGVTASFADGSAARSAVLIAADGANSTARRRLFPGWEAEPAGYAAWRGVVTLPAGERPRAATETWGRGVRFGAVPIGGGRTYWFATANGAGPPAEGEAAAGLLRGAFGAWHAPIPALLAATDPAAIIATPIVDLPPRPHWAAGRAALLGDAAHAMTPNLGQGAGQALEDAVVLGACLGAAAPAEPGAALAAYAHRRHARAAWIAARSRRMGRLGQLRGAAACALRDAVVRATPEAAALRTLHRIARFEP
jgi:2-polyprenyl-6-methoxyphenol hydroxylase-like FAD-dependent oxidoreductase